MITKIIACADIHFPAHKKNEALEVGLEKFYAYCEEIVRQEGGPEHVRIVVAGDIFHNKITVTNESILAVYDFLKRLNSIAKTIIIIGNHDYIEKNTDRVDSLTPQFIMGTLENTIYLDDALGRKSGCYVDDNVVWCLYSHFSGNAEPDIKSMEIQYPKDKYTYVGLIHGEINGCTTAAGKVFDNALSPEMFNECDCVIAGHIHKRQEINVSGVPIVYCSSLVQQDLGETVSGHGCVLWDIDNPTGKPMYEFVDIDTSDYGFYRIIISSPDDFDEDKEEITNL
jgi:DNA repair exonuclease SbcCD nuclease subunit